MMKLLYSAITIAACFNISAMDRMPQEFFNALQSSKTEVQQVPLSALERINPLVSEEELKNYRSTWNESLSLDENLVQLCQRFADTCCMFFAGSGDFIIRIPNGEEIRYNKMSQTKIDRFIVTLQQMSLNPVGCKLIRLLLTKYLSGTTASKFSKAYIVSTDTKGKFRFGHAPTAIYDMCVIPVSDFSGDGNSMFAGIDEKKARRIIGNGGSITQINGFPRMFFFDDNINHYDDVSLFGAMLRWFHHVNGVDVLSLEKSTDAILKRYALAQNENVRSDYSDSKAYESALVNRFSDDYFFRCMFGLVYDKTSDSMKMDPLNESAYTLVKNKTIRVFCSDSDKSDVDFTELFGDRELLEFYFKGQAKLPVFGFGQYKFSH